MPLDTQGTTARAWKHAGAAKAILSGASVGVSSWDDPPPPADTSMESLRDQLRDLYQRFRSYYADATSEAGRALARRALDHIAASAREAVKVASGALQGDFRSLVSLCNAAKRATVALGLDGTLAWAVLAWLFTRKAR